ncbi:sulfurtransferase [Candidimonas humi]|jgi:rhodanese-related sulfurtransferase|uniref:Rhodanese-like domain-containing protein n=1 Tax=Candidimonas humi TaxID=683355 RepID=A0ABV8NXU6_9BURK|nr:rhodanese-like domain-containing protein [Candidimonas humi]MBV6304849.1 sulfurtransferase [Candidimonas humi]
MHHIDARTLKTWLEDGSEIALFDVREAGQYGEGHLYYGITLPYSRLELDVERLAPRKSVRLVVHDDGKGPAPEAAARLAALGYTDVHVLDGGTTAWAAAGYILFKGVNVPSKSFGELAEHAYDTPYVTADELAAMQARGEDVVVVDGRPYSEYQKMNIPGAINCPNGELVHRIAALVPNEQTRIVVNCAGRTRSIIGAQTLINLGIRNPVVALQSGTQGWMLAGLQLEHGSSRLYGEPPETNGMIQGARLLAEKHQVPVVDDATVAQWARDTERSLFLCDVRTPEEFLRGSLPGAQHTPGGQLIQATDQYIGVRHARLVLFDSDGARALVVASWLRQMGHDASVLEAGTQSTLDLARDRAAAGILPSLPPAIAAPALQELLAGGKPLAVIDLRPSMQYRKGHISGSTWSIRPRLRAAVGAGTAAVVLVGEDEGVLACAAAELQDLDRPIHMLAGGFKGWREAGLPIEATPDLPADADCIDYLFFVHDRHAGNKEAARQYLAWEVNLVSQLDDYELGQFRLPAAAESH